jgi:MSHA biogenesis protein MshJ
MRNAPVNSIFESWQRWLSMRSHRERICILIIGWFTIYFFWYHALQKPLKLQRQHIEQQVQALKAQIKIFQMESDKVTKEAEVKVAKQQQSKQSQRASKIELATSSDSDEIIKEILSIQRNVQFVSLKSNASTDPVATNQTAAKALELIFNSNYFDTIAYLEQLEKIPWCLSWDSLSYKVTTYPMAAVTVHVSILIN